MNTEMGFKQLAGVALSKRDRQTTCGFSPFGAGTGEGLPLSKPFWKMEYIDNNVGIRTSNSLTQQNS